MEKARTTEPSTQVVQGVSDKPEVPRRLPGTSGNLVIRTASIHPQLECAGCLPGAPRVLRFTNPHNI